MGVWNAKQTAAAGDGFIQHTVEFLASVTALGDAVALALVIQKGGGGSLEDFVRKRGGAGSKVEDALFHAGSIVEAPWPFQPRQVGIPHLTAGPFST